MSDLRLLQPADQPALDAFLARHTPETMTLRSNLVRSGLREGNTPYHGRYAAAFEAGNIVGTVARYWNDMLVVYAPQHAADLTALLAGDRRPAGILGPWKQALDAQDVLQPAVTHYRLRIKEILMTLQLDRLQIPKPMLENQNLHCRLATTADIPLLQQWRIDYCCETLGATPSQHLNQSAHEETKLWVTEQAQFILMDGDLPVSGCCFNARVPGTVQIGNAWTPPQLRSRGYARAVIAGALQKARHDGATQATLFTAEDNRAGQTAYAALGFTPVGDYAILLFAD